MLYVSHRWQPDRSSPDVKGSINGFVENMLQCRYELYGEAPRNLALSKLLQMRTFRGEVLVHVLPDGN